MRFQPKKLYLADGDRLSLVPKSEATKLGVVGELLDADKLGRLDKSDNFLALLRKLWWLPRLATGCLVEVVKQ